MSVNVSRMTTEDIDGAIECIQQAFADDPYNNWIYPDRTKFSPIRNRASLRLRCNWGLQHGLFYVAKEASSPTVLGVSMWLPPTPPSAPQSWSLWLSGWTLWFRQGLMNLYYGRGGLIPRRYWIWKARQAEAQQELWTSPVGYYFCNIVVVRPGNQGKGIGKKLMNVVLERADQEGVPCYLESSRSDPNVKIYERMGFRCVKEMECRDMESVEKDTGVKLFCCIREPGAGPVIPGHAEERKSDGTV